VFGYHCPFSRVCAPGGVATAAAVLRRPEEEVQSRAGPEVDAFPEGQRVFCNQPKPEVNQR